MTWIIVMLYLLASLNALAEPMKVHDTIRILLPGDPFAAALNNIHHELEAAYGITLEFEIVSYNDVRNLTLLNAQDLISNYDIVAFDVVWLAEYAHNNVLMSLEDDIARFEAEIQPDDFLQSAYKASAYKGIKYGLPVQPHPETLWYRTDLFEAAGISPPVTTNDVIEAARLLHQPEKNQFGICWNGQRGQAFGQQMAHFYAAFGQPLLDENGQPTLDTPRGLAAAEYALALMQYSSPDILAMAWDQRILRYSSGNCAMTYAWGARLNMLEIQNRDILPLTGFAAAPHAPDANPITPLGVWSFGIPANIGENRDKALKFLNWITAPEQAKILARHGNGGMPRYSVIEDPALVERYPIFPLVSQLDRSGQLASWMRPAVPQWSDLAAIMGSVYHDMLQGRLSPQQAVQEAQRQAVSLFEANE